MLTGSVSHSLSLTMAAMPAPLEPPPVDFAASVYAEPGALGLIANIMAGLLVAVENMLNPPFSPMAQSLAGVHLIVFGGFLQLVAGLLCFRRFADHLTGTAFVVFAALWTVIGVNHILTPLLDPQVLSRGVMPGLLGFMGVSVVLCLCALTVNYLMPPVLIAILLALIFETVGTFFLWGRRVAAAFEIIIVLSSFYAVIVMTLKGVSQRYILPGFGNAIYDPLLIRTTASTSARRIERKKNTTYGEPMGMGYLGNVVPATVLIFHHLGYFQDFRPAMAMFIFSLFCHMLASYYAFLRHDFFHAVQFVVYFAFWMSRGITQLLMNMDGFADAALVQRINFYGQWSIVVLLIVVTLASIIFARVVFFYNLYFVVVAIMSVDHIPVFAHNFTFGVPTAVLAIVSTYVGMAHLENSIAEKPVMWLGSELVNEVKLIAILDSFFGGFHAPNKKNDYTEEDTIDMKVVDSICFIASSVALLSLSPMEATNFVLPVPWILTAGVFLHLYAARLAYAAGSLAKAYVMTVLAAFWAIWATFLLNPTLAVNLQGAAVTMLCLFTVVLVMTPTFTRVWIPFALFMELCVIAQVVTMFNSSPNWMVLITSLLTALISLYAAFAEIMNTTLMSNCIPVGEPVLKEKLLDDGGDPCPLLSSRRSSNLRRVVRLLNEGKIAGVPTDTVYAIAASCKHPDSISRLYHVKGRPPEKPICLCLSSLDQLAAVNPPFTPLMWNFLRRCYPGGISCVVPKGAWLKRLGLGDAAEFVGTKDNICIRVPDSSVLCYIVSLHGPIALTSANISGGEDSTHHSMVITELGEKLDVIVCDGESNETQPSTVVDCCKIDEGVISYFREGCTPKEYVDQLFEEAKADSDNKSTRIEISDSLGASKTKSA
ncbi:uncharacterized protein LOC112573854 isoform X1 [Pomacea canaliculata]|uniref:uncharacterized protein LOC112573854 isoform X1 n=2 Tax=Pomacea canaliculata TaxID=400727 RepID=UPI000D73195C|nr:uncharacterized protein LOC112573854 isoform X1 [Pomacea canaliculata]